MALDAIMVSALAEELNARLFDMRVEKLHQPEKDIFILSLRSRGGSARLLLSAGTGSARAHLTAISRENPQSPPMFCMLMRKHLLGARINTVSQPPLERIISIEFNATGDMGESVKKRVVVEMIGKHSNIILLDEDNRIIDCLRKVDMEMSEKRQVMPGMFYNLPPVQNKNDPFSLSREEISALLKLAPRDMKTDKWLLETFHAFSPLICREITFLVSGGTDTRISELDNASFLSVFCAFIETVKSRRFSPILLKDAEKPFDICSVPVKQYKNALLAEVMPSFSELLDEFYTGREQLERTKQRAQTLIRTIKSARDKAARKLAAQNEDLKATYGRERMRELGDIIKANLHVIDKGLAEFEAQDFYAAEQPATVKIKLDTKLNANQNAAKYYKMYSKAKNAETVLNEQIKNTETELEYLESVLEELERASGERDIAEIREELRLSGFAPGSRAKTGALNGKKMVKKQKVPESKPMRFLSSNGHTILVGRNNNQNDRLSIRSGYKSEVWLHTQKIPGAHVIITAPLDTVSEQTMREAACLAAYHSKARYSQNVPVDYTMVRNVKKPAGSKPGMVIYTNYKTIYATPDEKTINAMRIE